MEFYEYTENERVLGIINFAVKLVLVIALAFLIIYFFGSRHIIANASMEPMLNDGDYVLIDRLSHHFYKPKRFDLLLFKTSDGRIQVRRVIGLPGEKIRITEGQIYIDDAILATDLYEGEEIVSGIASEEIYVFDGEYFVLGDNPVYSEDSRFENFGNIKEEDIMGRVWLRIYPLNTIALIR